MVKVEIDQSWTEFYPVAEEMIPEDVLEPLGKECSITCYVDADHARDKVTCRSVTGILLLVNNTPLIWYTKRQKTVESSTYGSELVASKIGVEKVIAVRYKLRMLGMCVEGTSLMVGDNMSVILNTTIPSSMLKKKHNAVAYHKVRENIAAKVISFAHVPSTANMADVLTKPLNNELFHTLLKEYLFRNAKTTSLKHTVQTRYIRRVYSMKSSRADSIPKRGQAIISSGTNISYLNPLDLFIYQIEGKTLDIVEHGIEGGTSKTVPEVVGYGLVIDTERKKYLIRINKAVATEGVTSIATNQMRKTGLIVDDTPLEFGGSQMI